MSSLSRSIIAIVTIHLIATVTSQELEKRGPQGFLGMRGKKLAEGEQFYKRKPQFFVGVKGKKNMYDINDVFEPEMYYKRAPMGFMGVRGKKDPSSDEKRAPMGFVGMRGKKELYSEEEKRAPMGFVGMRGKKNLNSDEIKRAPMGFVGMRGKKDLFLEKDERDPMGFEVMRGEKDNMFLDDAYPESYEYLPETGSLIGQIDYASQNYDSGFPLLNEVLANYLNSLDNNLETVTDANETNEGEQLTNELEKRASNIHQFFGVRGKKSLQNKRPYDVTFRGKFIGVRGKKDLKNSGAQEIKFMLENGPLPKRKGFMGMRGKKWTDESAPETPN